MHSARRMHRSRLWNHVKQDERHGNNVREAQIPGCAATNANFHAFPRSNGILNRTVVSSVSALTELGVRPVLVADEDIPHLELTASC